MTKLKTVAITVVVMIIILSNISPNTITSIGEIRNPLCLVSWDTGIVLNDNGDGMITSPFTDSYYNYTYYDNRKENEKVFTIWVYNPFSLYADDLIYRKDF